MPSITSISNNRVISSPVQSVNSRRSFFISVSRISIGCACTNSSILRDQADSASTGGLQTSQASQRSNVDCSPKYSRISLRRQRGRVAKPSIASSRPCLCIRSVSRCGTVRVGSCSVSRPANTPLADSNCSSESQATRCATMLRNLPAVIDRLCSSVAKRKVSSPSSERAACRYA